VIDALHILKAWNAYLLQTYQLKIVDWEDESYVNPEDYMEFCLNIFNPDMDNDSVIQSPSKAPSSPSPSPASTVKVRKADLAHQFWKGVKCDKSHYTPWMRMTEETQVRWTAKEQQLRDYFRRNRRDTNSASQYDENEAIMIE